MDYVCCCFIQLLFISLVLDFLKFLCIRSKKHRKKNQSHKKKSGAASQASEAVTGAPNEAVVGAPSEITVVAPSEAVADASALQTSASEDAARSTASKVVKKRKK